MRSRLPEGPPQRGFLPLAPDLVIEVVSPNDLAWEVHEKIEQWLDAGVQVVWEVLPAAKSVMVHRPGADVQKLQEADDLTLPGLLPDFRVPVAAVFPPAPAAGK